MSLRAHSVAAIRRRLPELDEEAAWRGALAGAASLFLLLVAVAVLVPLREQLDTGSLALVLLLPPLVASSGGRALSLVLALISALTFNFLFTQPYNSFRIESSASIAAFVIYVLIALVLATYVSGFRDASAAATRRALTMEQLQTLAVGLIRSDDLRPPLRRALSDLSGALGLRGAALRATVAASEISERTGDDRTATNRLDHALHPAGAPEVVSLRGEDGLVTLPISDGGITFGLLAVDTGHRRADPETLSVLESFCGILGLALGRAQLQYEGVQLQALKETDRLRAALLQSVSHDLRTPLTAITASASALRESVPENEREALLDGIEHEARRLVRLVESMLDLSRIEAGALRPRQTRMPVEELLYAAVDDAAAALGDQIVDVDGADEVPPVSVDETMMRQVLVNLLENASRADPDDAIGLYAASDGATVRITVVDHGPGVPEAERRRIFEPYYRLRPAHDRSTGSGLGLAISRGFVEAHGGHISVEPTAGGGATFVVELPAEPMKRPSVLIVDDEPTVLRALRVALEAQEYVVTAVLTGEDALARVTNGSFDVIVLDLGLPGMSGFDVIRRVRVLFPALPIIVLSAQGDDAPKVEALDLGADDYVAKPFSVRELLARVRVALRHAESAAGALAESSTLERGSIRVDLAEHTAIVRGEVVSLTRTQFALLATFMRHPGRLLTHRAIVAEVWGDPDAAAADNLRVQISQLRRRIEEDPRHPALIVTEPGLGYRFLST